jgi:hypothetical protein
MNTSILKLLQSFAVLAIVLLSSVALAKKDDQGNKVKEKDQKQEQPADGKNDQPKIKMTSEQRWLVNIHDQIKPTDDEWEILAPRIENIIRLQNEVRAGRDPRGPREPKPDKPQSADQPAKPISDIVAKARELSATLFNESAPASDVRMKVAAIREARAKAHRDLNTAQEDLRQLLTYRQEAVLIIMGILE